jgi:polysaccharide chain length determinant protein (PEP-CTERM system associated)
VAVRAYSIGEVVRLLARRRWLVLVPLALGAAAAPLLARVLPSRYQSDATLLVIPQQVPDNFVKPTVSESVQDRLPAITAQILSRTELERIIRDENLYAALRARDVMEDVVATMRRDVTTTAVGRDVNSFRVSYVSDSAERAWKVTKELAELYVDQNLKDRQDQADNTRVFLDKQLADAKAGLVEQEKKLEAYRRAHAGQMPSQLQGNLQAIQNANLQLQALNEATSRAQERRLLIERQIADAQAAPAPGPAVPLPARDAGAAMSMSTAQQLDLARARLAQLLQRYTPDYPEVVSQQHLVNELSARLERETPVGVAPAEKVVTPAEAARQKQVLDLKAELDVIDHQLAQNRADGDTLKQTIAQYQANVDAVPTRESELVELTRDYSTMQAAYSNLLTKREDSVIAANLEKGQIGERFTLLDPASFPEKPYNQRQRLAVMAVGPLAGLFLGLLGVGALEFRDTSFRAPGEVMAALSLPVLASIPVMISRRERNAARRRAWLKDLGGVVVVLASIAMLVWWRMRTGM